MFLKIGLFPFCNLRTAPRLRMGKISRKQRGGNLIGWHYHPPHLLSSDQLDSHKYIFLLTIQNAANLWYCTHSIWSVQILVFRLLNTTLDNMKRQGVRWGMDWLGEMAISSCVAPISIHSRNDEKRLVCSLRRWFSALKLCSSIKTEVTDLCYNYQSYI